MCVYVCNAERDREKNRIVSVCIYLIMKVCVLKWVRACNDIGDRCKERKIMC